LLLLLNPHKLLVAVGISLVNVDALWTEVIGWARCQMLSVGEPNIRLVHHHMISTTIIIVVVRAEARSCSLIELILWTLNIMLLLLVLLLY
jgi:hypothetical protein